MAVVNRRAAAAIATAVAVVAAATGIVILGGALALGPRVLDEDLYAGALVRADAYERLYTEVLADPELAETAERLAGGLDLGRVDPGQARILVTNSLRLVLPPDHLQAGTERVLAALLAYLRGDTPRLDADFDLSAALADVERTAVTQVRAALARVPTRPAASAAELRAGLDEAARELREGRLPAAIPVPAGAVGGDDVIAALRDVVGGDLPPDLEVTVRTLLDAGAGADASAAALAPLVGGHAAEQVAQLRRDLEDGRELDLTAEVAERAGTTPRRVVERLDWVRDAVGRYRTLAVAAGAALLASGFAAIAALHRRRATRALALIAAATVLGGIALFGVWLAVRHTVDPPLAAATGTGAGSWDLPAGTRAVVRDVEAQVADDLESLAARVARLVALAGLLVAAAVVAVRSDRRRVRAVAVAAGAAALVLAVLAAADLRRPPPRACNGHPALCDRRYDEVVQFATHNSMSSPDVVQVWPEQDGTITEQLDAGVRALLIDAHYWPDLLSAQQLAAADPAVPAAVAERVAAVDRERLRGREGVFMCHNLCAWGGRPLVDGLGDVREFLDANPNEVVTIVLQDEVEPADAVAAFRDAGLEPYAYRHDHEGEWPTLGEMIDRGERLVVFAENSGPPPGWYASAFDVIADTPFGFAEPEDMSCAPNRGPADAPLFLMNHWLTRAAPDRKAAALVNTREAVVERARRCAAERGRLPNLVAVDFFTIGDVRGAVDVLNGLRD
ncbi:MAG: hypothetical protein KatS3mg009_2880 [Acidimicrobiia bacterium]|nr:MAG: hypothetical protein KatS3mg009_2880 [Acidimicrobiia bacterium]